MSLPAHAPQNFELDSALIGGLQTIAGDKGVIGAGPASRAAVSIALIRTRRTSIPRPASESMNAAHHGYDSAQQWTRLDTHPRAR
jgi:hypothetical protein